jgi:hypothetical protein
VLFARRSLTAPLVVVLAALVLAGVVAPVPARAAGPVTDEVLVVAAARQGAYLFNPDAMDQTAAALNGPVHDYWAEQSFGAIEVHATAWPTYLSTTATCGDIQGVYAEVAAATGFQPGPGRHLLVYGAALGENLPGCSYFDADLGTGRGSGGRAYVRSWGANDLVRALGRNFGLPDSDAQQCIDSVVWGTCATEPRGDGYDPMGNNVNSAVGSLSMPQAARLGVLPADRRVAVSSNANTSGTVTLKPLSGRTGVLAVELADPSSHISYWLELRAATGRDSWVTSAYPSPLQAGVLLRRTGPADAGVTLLDPTPTGHEWYAGIAWEQNRQVAMPVGQDINLGNTFHVAVTAVSPTSATVRFTTRGDSYAGDAFCISSWRPTAPMTGVALIDNGGLAAAALGRDRSLWLRPVDGGAAWFPLGGAALYGPAGTTAGTTSYLFVVGGDGGLYYRAGSGTSWGPWASLGGRLTSTPAAASLGNGHVRVFGRGADGTLWSREFSNGRWSDWIGHGGVMTAMPTATADVASGRIVVVVRGTDGYLWEQSMPPGGAGPFRRYDEGASCSALAMGSTRVPGDAGLGVYLDRNSSPRLFTTMGSRTIGGSVTTTPAVQFVGDGFLVAGRGADGALWIHDRRPGGTGWVSLGGSIL